ncbi:uncharacterized protein K452DRAFT_308048 [Aplosporella prunicola CBS 121167]|uniref:Actin interacting protein 3 C-terminal domain-containing protein n=1 Tax=Aplosporella prunicola CBS 121167 TaxID=1176127 RepID=A0A6A6BDU1_9PEZI|nr:uncharacterized protein K452DRAFT_308048 [Aplosporella prunicola CBS 121167]KAF2142359.1 hypothetical protein K452DRAFT_308048 [Aplosporella prunicola CBS 121167]
MADDAGTRSSSASSRSAQSRRALNPQQQLSQIEKSVTHLLVATKQLLETLTLWSRGTATESEVSDVYVRLGYEFNIASRAFNAIGVDTSDLGNVPELLRSILEETLSQEASQASLDRFLPRIRDIIINLLHGLKKKQQRLRQRSNRDSNGTNGTSSRHESLGEEELPQRTSSRQSGGRHGSGDLGHSHPGLPPRTISAPGRSSPSKYDSLPASSKSPRNTRESSNSSLSSNAAQNIPIIAPYPDEERMPAHPENPTPKYNVADFPPPPPPPKQEDALLTLQRSGELERRASRRFSAYQIQKHLGSSPMPMLPTQTTPVPNRGRDARDSMNAVRNRASMLPSRQRSAQRVPQDTSPSRTNNLAARRISEEPSHADATAPSIPPPEEEAQEESPVKTPADKLRPEDAGDEKPELGATVTGPVDEAGLGGPVEEPAQGGLATAPRDAKSPTPQPGEFIPHQSPQPGKELTLFLQYKSKIKKFTLADGYNDLSLARLQLAFIEKFAWNTHNNGVDLPDIYIQDPVSGVRHELEDLSDIKDRAVLVLNVEVLDEVKRHFDDGLGDLRKLVEGIKSAVTDQQSAIQRVSDRQVDAAKEMASLAAAPPVSARASVVSPPAVSAASTAPTPKNSAGQMSEIQSLRRDLAVVRQTYTSFVADIEASMGTIRTKAASVKSTAFKAAIPTLSGDSGRAYVNGGKKTLNDDSEKIVNKVDDLQDLVEDLRKDVVSRGVRPVPRQLEAVAKDISVATSEVKRLQDFLKKEKPLWTKIWEQELQMVMEDREMLTMQEELALDLQDDLEKLSETFGLVEQATKQQMQSTPTNRAANARANLRSIDADTSADPREAKDGVLGEVRALQPNHEGRLEAIERAEKARQRELESRRGGEFQRELGAFVEEGKLKKSGGVEEIERQRVIKDERIRKEVFERQAQMAIEREKKRADAAAARKAAAAAEAEKAAAPEGEAENEEPKDGAAPETEAKEEQPAATEGGEPSAAES